MILVEKLVKTFGPVCALNDFSVHIDRGTLFGLVGANGAGKSTLLKSVIGLVKPDQGKILVDNNEVATHPLEVRRRIGYAPEEAVLYEYLTGYEFLQFVGSIRCIEKKKLQSEIESLLADFDLTEKSQTLISEYSHGMRKKISLAAALLGNPPVLLLDEPTNGLDPENVYRFKKRLVDQCQKGVTVIFSSHILDTVEKICDRVGIIHLGRLLAQDTVAGLKSSMKGCKSLEEVYLKMINPLK
jgi:ABC-2 type transport system ATP-binding protein